jgi:transposase-like protein
MATPTRKRKAISLETKYEIIQCVEMGNEPNKDVAARIDILPNTLSTILKNKEKIVESFEKSTISPARKCHRSSAHENVDAALYEWFKEKRSQNIVSTESKSDNDIVGDLLNKESDTDDSEIVDELIEENVPTKIVQGLETVRRVLETHENVDEKLISALAKIEQIFTCKQKQTDIASFFNKI